MARTSSPGRRVIKVVAVRTPKTAKQRHAEAVAEAVTKFGQDRVREFLKMHGKDSVQFLLKRRTLWGARRAAKRAAGKASRKRLKK